MRTQLQRLFAATIPLIIISTVLFVPIAEAQEEGDVEAPKTEAPKKEEPKKEKELPKSGSLSSTISGVHGSRSVEGPWGGTGLKDEGPPPISGSVSRVSASKWEMRVFNNSENSYSVNLAVHQFDRMDKKVKSDSFSYSLRPHQSVERPISATATTEQCSLDLLSWKKTSK